MVLSVASLLPAAEVQIAGGQSHTVVLTPDGRVWAFGDDSSGQLGDDTTQADKASGVLVSGLTNIIAVAAGREHSLALRADGSVWSWGANNAKQLGNITDSAATFKTTPQAVNGLAYIVAIAAGGDHSLAVDRSGNVYAWGSDSEGQLGNGATAGNQITATIVQAVGGGGSLVKAIAVAAGSAHSMALLGDGTVVAWGRDDEGQLGNGGAVTLDQTVPGVVSSLSTVTAIAGGQFHSLARLADGTVRGWGKNDVGQLGTLSPTNQAAAVNPGLSLVKGVVAGDNHSVFLRSDGTLVACGNDIQGAVGNDGSLVNVTTPAGVSLAGFVSVRAVGAGGNHTVAALGSGGFRSWGADNQLQLGNGTSPSANQATPSVVEVTWPMVAMTRAEAGQSHTVALQGDGSVWAWGNGGSGQLGDNAGGSSLVPVQVKGAGGVGTLGEIIAISSGSDFGDHNLALAANGVVWAWGRGSNGQLGNNGTSSAVVPVKVRNPSNSGDLQHIIAIAAGDNHSVALAVDGTVYTWGLNSTGQLGNNSLTPTQLPVKVKISGGLFDLSNIKRLAAGGAHSLAINAAGDLIGWGSDAYGQMGDGASAASKVVAYTMDTGEWIAIAAGANHTRAIRHDSVLAACGYNFYGQLGIGNEVDQNTLFTSFGFSRGIAAGAYHSLTWQSWGGMYGAGWNDYAQLGLGYKSPKVINHIQANSLGVFPYQMDGGYLHSVVVKADGTVWCSGYNGSGQLGTGSTTEALEAAATSATWLPTITITASDASANEQGLDPGVFTITRTGTTAGAMTVRVALDASTTAASGDYSPTIPSTITIPQGQASVTFTVTPIQDFVYEASESVVLRLQQVAGDPYVLSPAAATQVATVTILDNDPVGLSVSQSVNPRLLTSETEVLTGTGVYYDNINDLDVITFAPGTDLSAARAEMYFYYYDSDNGGPNFGTTTQIAAVDDLNDTISVSPGFLMPSAVPGLIYIGYYSFFQVRLTSQPSASVTVRLQSENTAEGTISPNSLTFTPSNWSQYQTVYVYSGDDADDEGAGSAGDQLYDISFIPPTASEALDPAYVGVTHAAIPVTNVDNDEAGVVFSHTSLQVTEGGNKDGYAIRLASRPGKDVTIDLDSVGSQVALDPVSVVFTSDNWDQPQAVQVTAVDDVFVEGGHADTLTYTLTSDDPFYNGLVVTDPPTVAITDNDSAGIDVIPATSAMSPVITAEEDASGTTLRIRLTASPSPALNVRVQLDVAGWPGLLGDSPYFDAMASTVQLDFNSTNWDTYQVVTLHVPTDANNAVEDFTVAVTTADAATTDNNFDTTSTTIYCRTQDNDSTGIVLRNLTPSGALTTDTGTNVTEGGAVDRVAVRLSVIPDGSETIVVTINGGTQTSTAPSFLIFNAANFATEQVVTVTAIDDFVDEAATSAASVAFSLASYGSGAPVYDSSIATSLIANVSDNDTANIVVTPTSGLVTTEAGGQATFSVVLSSQPADTVTVGLSVGGLDSDEAQLAVASVIFTTTNWSQTQTITVTGRSDSLDDGDRSYTIITAAATVAGSGDSNYAGRNPSDVQGTNVDDDAIGVTMSTTSIAVSEGGTFIDYTIRLASQPTTAVTVTINPGNQLLVDTDLTSPLTYQNTLQFDPDNTGGRIWSTARTVRVTAIDDDLAENNPETVLVTHNATGGDYANVVIANVSVSVTDNDTAGFFFDGLVSVPAGLTTTESGGTALYTMRLRSQPTAEVRFTVVTSDVAAGTVDVDDLSPGVQDTLIFTPANWNVDRNVTITGVDDDVVDGDQAYDIISYTAVSADFKYNGLVPLAVPCTTTDNDTASIAISPTTGLTTTEGGGQATFSVVLTSQPTEAVIVTFSSSSTLQGTVDTDAVAPSDQDTLTFTPATWDVVRTVTITGADGDNADNGVAGIAYQILTGLVDSDDVNYNGLDPVDIDVTNLAINQAPTLVAIGNLTIAEDATTQNVALSGISDGQTGENQTLSFSATSDNLSLIPAAGVSYTSGTTGTLSFAPAADETGTATITVTVTDSGGPGVLAAESLVRTFTVTVTEVNDRPTLTAIASPVSLNEDAPTQNLTLTGLGSGAANETQTLTVTAVSSNTSLIPNPLFTSSGSNVVVLAAGTAVADLTYAPVANTNGTAVVTITVQDDGGTAGGGIDTFSRQFTINVAVVNDPPTLDDPSDVVLNEDAGAQTINLTGITSGAANEIQTLVLTATSSDTALIPHPTLSYTSPGAAGTLSFTPTAELGGQATITVTVNDGGGGTQTQVHTFTATVNPVNDVPVATTSAASGRTVPIGTNRVIAATDLYATDVDSAAPAPAHDPALIFTVQLAPGQGFLLRDQDTLDAPVIDPADAVVLELGDTFTQQDLIDGRISYTHDGGSGASDGFAFTVSDNGIAAGSVSASPVLPAANLPAAASGLQVFTLTIDRRPPVITLLPATTLAFTEDDAATRVGLSSTLTDGDFSGVTGFTGGRLTVDFSAGGTVDDVIGFDTTGPVTLVGTNVLHNGNLIGNFTATQGVGGTLMEVNFTSAQADLTSVADLIRHLTFRNLSPAASSAETTPVTARTVRMVMTDDNGDTSSPATRQVEVTSVNDAPTSATFTTLVTGVNVPIAGTLSVDDVDGDILAFAAEGLSTLGTVTVNAVTGAYTFTPATNQSGAGTFTIRVSDPLGATTDIDFTVTISADAATRPWITSDPPMSALEGDIVTYNIIAESPGTATPGFTIVGLAASDYVLSVTGTTATLTLPANTLATPGHLNFGILVTDGPLTGFQPVTIVVIAAPAGGG